MINFRKAAGCQLAAFAAGVILALAAPTFAQVAGATLSGTVTDSSGAVVPQAQIVIKNVATAVSTPAITNGDGFYSVPNLLPGNYEVTVSASGFKTEIRSGIALTVGAQQVLNITMQVGQVTESVQVTSAAPAVQLASSNLSAVVSSNTVVELPLNGRDWTQLATLQPAVNVVLTQAPTGTNAVRGNRGFGNQMSISGTRPQLNNYRLDGISIVDYAGGAPGSVLGVQLGVDAVQEFSVITSNYSAEYGRTSGGVVNAITRSGTNQFHGDAYWFLRDEGLDARSFFDVNLPPFHRNQFGGSLGGPIRKDKTFFFVDYEGFRQGLGVTNKDFVPSADARNGILQNPDGTTTTVALDPTVARYLNFYPAVNAGLLATGNTGVALVSTNNNETENYVTNKIDQKISDKDSLIGSWFYDHGLNDAPDSLNEWTIGNEDTRVVTTLEETHIFSSSLVNSVRGGYSRDAATSNFPVAAINPLSKDLSLGSFPGKYAAQVTVPGLTTADGGLGSISSPRHYWNSFQAYDDAFLTKGNHSIKFGGAFERIEHNMLIFTRPNGTFSFGSLQGFLTNQPVTFNADVPGTETPRGARQSLFGGYLQDDWKARPNLTLNLGLRYEMVTVPTEVQNKLVNLPTFTSATPNLGSPYFNNPTYRNFEPRLGFSWDPFKDGKTAVRGAFGIFDVLPLNYEFFLTEALSAPFAEILTASNLAPGTFPTGATAAGNINPSTLQSASIQENPPRNYVMIWNLNVQHELTRSTSLMVAYVGNHGVHMLDRADDVNLVMPTLTPEGYLWPSPRGSGTRLNPNVGDIRGLYWDGDAEYDALEAHVIKKMSHGFQAEGSYTWGKAIDDGSASVVGDPFTNSISSLFWFCKQCRRGLSDFNIAQNLTVNFVWDVPTPARWGKAASRVLGGWEVGSIITAQTGMPMTPIIGGDPLGLNSNDPWAYPDRLTGPGCGSLVNPGSINYIKVNCFAASNPLTLLGNSGRNIITGPGLLDWDFSLFKNTPVRRISENFNVQFRAEFFNVLNRPNFLTPVDNEAIFDQSGNPVANAGALDNISTTPREIQFALKLIW